MNRLFALGLPVATGIIMLAGAFTKELIVTPQQHYNYYNSSDENTGTVSALDTVPPVRIKERQGDFLTGKSENPFDLKDPKAIEQKVEYDPVTGYYILREKVGDNNYREPTYMTEKEYLDYTAKKERKDYFKSLVIQSSEKPGEDPIKPYEASIKDNLIDRLFGGHEIDIRPQGNVALTFGGDYQRIDNPILTQRQQRFGGFNFDMNIQLNVVGKIGERLKLTTNYNTQANFNFDNQIKLEFSSDNVFTEDAILKKIEAGNVSFPLKSSLIQGVNSLFGFKTQLQFGKLTTTLLVSQQQSQRKEISVQNGSQQSKFNLNADDYDANHHFFLTHYNRGSYENALKNIPQINTLFHITRMEVWASNRNRSTEEVRDVIAFVDMGESDATHLSNPNRVIVNPLAPTDIYGKPLPGNESNMLYSSIKSNQKCRSIDYSSTELGGSRFGLRSPQDFTQKRLRKLQPTEYSFHADLGFLSVPSAGENDVVAVAFEYTYNGKVYKVGEFAQDVPAVNSGGDSSRTVLFLKLIKFQSPTVGTPLWDLMMKNVYNIGGYQVNPEDFHLDIYYQDPGAGDKRFLPDGPIARKSLLSELNLDHLNRSNDPYPDGQFDFVPGLTILPATGRIIFPVLEPFGRSLRSKLVDPNTGAEDVNAVKKYVYQQLYDSTLTAARMFPELNRFLIKGTFKSSSSSEISLGAFNIPRGSVTVTAGGKVLVEGTDYTIDYNLGKVKILNEAYLAGGAPIKVSFEDRSLFGFQTRTLLGSRFDFMVNDKFNIGATVMHLSERPFTRKVNIGDDPISNTVIGTDFHFTKDAPWLTKLLDKLPLYSTKAASRINLSGEAAVLIPGHPSVIDQGIDEGGSVYIDDFEGSAARYPLGLPAISWSMASTPGDDGKGNNRLFPEASLKTKEYNFNRARMSWYNIDPILTGGGKPDSVTLFNPNSNYVRTIFQKEVFKNYEDPNVQNPILRTFDLAYYPKERGQYNFDVHPTSVSKGIDTNGDLIDPKSRWGGLMRTIETPDFENSNIEYVELWVMNPFTEGKGGTGGDMYINLGQVSEDVLPDSRPSFENGLPGPGSTTRADSTTWAHVPRIPPIIDAFDNDPAVRLAQDVGLDGENNSYERIRYAAFLNDIDNFPSLNPVVKAQLHEDPASDDYRFYLSTSFNNNTFNGDYERYKYYNNTQGNSPASSPNSSIVTAATNKPDAEDLDKSGNADSDEAYYQYKITFRKDATKDEIDSTKLPYFISSVLADNSGTTPIRWYQIKVPIDQFTSKVGAINGFRNIRYIRTYMHNWQEHVVLRFARFDLVRNQWRRYTRSLKANVPGIPTDNDPYTTFDLRAVNIIDNSGRTPVPYVLPPGIQRERALGPLPNARQNEQSLAMHITNLRDGDARAIYKNLALDLRLYKRFKLFTHAEALPNSPLHDGEMHCFVRIGSDYEQNYYEYEIPLKTTPLYTSNGDANVIWPSDNVFDFPLDLLRNIKTARDEVGYSKAQIYERVGFDPNRPNAIVRIIGNPDLGLVEGAMVGLKNPAKTNSSDDGQDKSAEVWIDELRVTGFDERGGYAALARMDATLADLGTLTVSGSIKSVGWGSLEQRLIQRSRESITNWDISTVINLDKFMPKSWGIRLPMFFQIQREVRTPQYDPYSRDIPLDDKLAHTTAAQKDSVQREALTVNEVKSLNFTNVRKERTNKAAKPMPWDIANFSATYAYTNRYQRNPLVASDDLTEHRGVLDYNYTTPPMYIMPFSSLIKKGTYLKWIKDINFNLVPNSFQFRNELNRRYGRTEYRFSDGEVFYEKQFTWNRSYNLSWDLTKSIRIQFTANNRSIIDEPNQGPADSKQVWSGLSKFGRNKEYTQSASVSYQVPFKSIPILDWIDVKAQYSTTSGWTRAALNADSLGNDIRNTQSRQITGDFNFANLYNKVPYLKKINTPPADPGKGGGKDGKGGKGADVKGGGGKAVGKDGKEIAGEDKSPDDPKNPKDPSKAGDGGKGDASGKGDAKTADGKGGKGAKGKDPKAKKEREISWAERIILRPLMSIRRLKVNYKEDFASIVPGFMPQHKYLGNTSDFTAPGLDFAFGRQIDHQWLESAAAKGWISSSVFLNKQVSQTHTLNYDAQMAIELFQDFKIDIDIKKTLTDNYTEYFKVDSFSRPGVYHHLTPMRMGSMNISYLPIRTLLSSDSIRGLFHKFEQNRIIISQRLGTGSHGIDGGGYTQGYGRTQQDVLIPAFLAAYTGADPKTIYTGDIRNLLPMPNWKLTFNGLAKLRPFSKYFSSVNITHGYKSTLNVNSFTTNNQNAQDPNQLNTTTQNFYSQFNIPNLVINEQFAPLIGIDVRLKNEITARFEYKKSRNLALNFTDFQLAETNTTEIVGGFGFKLKNFNPFSKNKGKGKKDDKGKGGAKPEEKSVLNLGLGSVKPVYDLNFKFDFSLRDDITYNHLLDQQVTQPTRGSKTIKISPSVDYILNNKLTIRLFVDYNQTIPYTSQAFKTTNVQGGLQLRFTLTQ